MPSLRDNNSKTKSLNMKKIVLVLLLVVVYNNLFAFVSQGHWRWRNDDGSEKTATWMAAQDVTATISDASKNIRLRVELYNDDPNSNDPKDAVFEYALDGTDTWFTITTTAGANAFVLSGTSPNVTDLEATTQQITAGVGLTFESGKVIVSSDKIPSKPVSAHAETEYEYCFKPTSAIKPNTTYQFRVDATNHNAGFTNPKLKTAAVLPVTFTGLTLNQWNGGVQINWKTGYEQNNDHFSVERSTDGSKWKTIETVQAANVAHAYEAFDATPVAGKNYYRIIQTDKDGKSSASSVEQITIDGSKLFASFVSPNPVVNNINLVVKNYEGVLGATLVSSNGHVLLSKTIIVSSGSSNYALVLPSKPAPGLYLLRLTGKGIDQVIKVQLQ